TLLADAWRQRRPGSAWLPAVFLLGFTAKLAYESATGMAIFVDTRQGGFEVAAGAHLVGGLTGVAAGRISGNKPCLPRPRFQSRAGGRSGRSATACRGTGGRPPAE